MTPTEQLKKAQELVTAYRALEVPTDYDFPVLMLFIRALCTRWTLKVTTNREN